MQAQRSLVLRVHAGDHRVDAARPRALDERLDQRAADALSAPVGADVHGVLDGEAVAGKRAVVAEAADPGDARLVADDEDREAALAAPGEPSHPVLEASAGSSLKTDVEVAMTSLKIARMPATSPSCASSMAIVPGAGIGREA